MSYLPTELMLASVIIIYSISTARRDESGEFYLPQLRVGTSHTGLRAGVSWESLDYCPRLAAQNPLGVICFLVPAVQLVYVVVYWKESKEAFFLLLAGLGLVILAALTGVPGH